VKTIFTATVATTKEEKGKKKLKPIATKIE
jgi:hypothetical protein